jgi:hypothetical protein
VSASSGEWGGTKHAGIYSREGFDFGSGGSQFARRQPVAAGRQLVVARRQLVAARREQLDTRRGMVDARLVLLGASW